MDHDTMRCAPVAVSRCEEYDETLIEEILESHFAAAGADGSYFRGKRVVLKPNLVSAKKPEYAVTTHPAVVEAVYRLVKKSGAADVVLAESAGGPYSAAFMNRILDVTGMKDLSDRTGLRLNDDYSGVAIPFAEGKKLKNVEVLKPVAESDIIVNICKLKTHSLTGLSCATKNLFGVIPGVLKFEMHAAYPDPEEFCRMLVDLNLSLLQSHEVLNVCDAVVAMEGNGPTHGTPVPMGYIMTSKSAFALDVVAEHAACIEGMAEYLDIAAELGLVLREIDGVKVINCKTGQIVQKKLTPPDSKKMSFSMRVLTGMPNLFGGRFSRFFEPRPSVNRKKCIGCGNCARVCPEKTITMKKTKGKKLATIKRDRCIRCFCCQELCPHGAVDTVKNPLIKLIH